MKTKINKSATIELTCKELTKLIKDNLSQITNDKEILSYEIICVSENVVTEYDGGVNDPGIDVFKGITIHLDSKEK